MSDIGDPYPFEGEDGDEITELNLEDLDRFGEERITVGELAGAVESWRFGHVIVDEAQDLTPMQWRMVMRRVRGESLTIVGDLAQRSVAAPAPWAQPSEGANETRPPGGGWSEQLPPELADIERLDLTINYRSPSEIHAVALQVLAEFAPDITPSRSIRSAGVAPSFVETESVAGALAQSVRELADQVGGQVGVIGLGVAELLAQDRGWVDDERIRPLEPADSKGLEFDAVLLVEPASIWSEPGGAALLYIALTRATQRLVVLHSDPLPQVLQGN